MTPYLFAFFTACIMGREINGRIPVIWCKRAYQDGKRALSRGKSRPRWSSPGDDSWNLSKALFIFFLFEYNENALKFSGF